MVTTNKLQTVARFVGDSPFSEAQVRWWIFNERHNGLASHDAIVRIGRRVYVNPEGFDRWIASQQEVRRAVA